ATGSRRRRSGACARIRIFHGTCCNEEGSIMNTPEWLNGLLLDPRITDLCINGAGPGTVSVYADQGDGLKSVPDCRGFDSEDALRSWTLAQLSQVGKS